MVRCSPDHNLVVDVDPALQANLYRTCSRMSRYNVAREMKAECSEEVGKKDHQVQRNAQLGNIGLQCFVSMHRRLYGSDWNGAMG